MFGEMAKALASAATQMPYAPTQHFSNSFLKTITSNQSLIWAVGLAIQPRVKPKGIHYHGIDVAKSVIESNQKIYSSPTVKFSVLGSYEELPQADLLICKDMLMHLGRKEVQAIIRDAFPKFTNVLITSDVHPYSKVGEFFLKARGKWEGMFNEDILIGQMTPFDIRMSPYNLPGKTVFSWTLPFPSLFKRTSVALATAKGNAESENAIRRTLRYPLRFLQAIALRDCIWRKETVLVQPQQP